MLLLIHLTFLACLSCSLGTPEVTELIDRNLLLSRTKRYLIFPPGTNMAVGFSGVKALIRPQPTGINVLGEMESPFALPTDTRMFKKSSYIKKSRREIYSTLDKAMTVIGLNGTACVRKMICDAKEYVPMKGKSMIRDILLVIFDFPEEEFNNEKINCTEDLSTSCSISIMKHVLQDINPDY